jgi:hypothetical protein
MILRPKSGALMRVCGCLVGLIALAVAPYLVLAQAAPKEIGVLTCSLAENGEDSRGDAASRKMLCVFRPANSGPEETYTGDFQAIGQRHSVMIWVVTATAAMDTIPSGVLQQVYVADPAAAPGHPPPLIGETSGSIVLQPMTDTLARMAPDNKQPVYSSMIIVVLLRLLSSPA